MKGDRPSTLQDSDELIGVRIAERRCGDRARAIGEPLNSGMSLTMMIGADRTDQDAGGSL